MQNRNRLTDTENPLLVTKGEKEVKGMYGIQTYKLLGLPWSSDKTPTQGALAQPWVRELDPT